MIQGVVLDTGNPCLFQVFDLLAIIGVAEIIHCCLQVIFLILDLLFSLIDGHLDSFVVFVCLSNYDVVFQNFFFPTFSFVVGVRSSLLWYIS